MRTFFPKLWAALVVALLAFTNAFAQQADQRLVGTAGYDPREQGGWMQLAFSDVAADGSYTVTTSGQIAISFVDLSMPEDLIEKTVDKRDGVTPVWLYRIRSATLHPMPLGKNWGNMPTDPQQVDLSAVRINGQSVVGQVVNGNSSLRFTRATGELRRPVNFIIRFPNGRQVWGSQPGQTPADSPYTAVSVDNRPLTVWSFEGNKVVPAPADVIAAFKGQK